MTEKNLLVRLQEQMPVLSKSHKRIAAFILENYDQAAYFTAAQLGQATGASESTVVRFAYAMDYDGYPALQKSLQELIRNKLTAPQRIQLSAGLDEADVLKTVLRADMSNIRATIDAIPNEVFLGAVDALLNAKRVYIIGLRAASPLAQFLSYYLTFVRDNVMHVNGAISEIQDQLVRITQEDVCVCISFPRYSTRTVRAMQYAKQQGATTVAITDHPSSPLAQLADYALSARSDMASFADSLVAPLSLINAIIVAAGIKRRGEVTELFNQLESIWGSERVYMTQDQE